MNKFELTALRKLFFLSMQEAADHVAEYASARNWRRMESGKMAVTPDVAEKMKNLSYSRSRILQKMTAAEYGIGVEELRWHETYEDFVDENEDASFLDWRISQSAKAAYIAENRYMTLLEK